MKKLLLLLVLSLGSLTAAHAQLPNGSMPPNITANDINGVPHNLYDLLADGKTVYLDMFATWCGPCWNYHNSHALKTIWDTYGPTGTDQAYVMAIECDASTNVQCLYGPSGCVGGTQGDWVTGTPYPFLDNAQAGNDFNVNYYPTIYMVCPGNAPADYKIYEAGQLGATGLWNFRSQKCAAAPLAGVINDINNVRCFGTNTGSIDISVSGGTIPYAYNWSNGTHNQDLTNVAAGTYTCTVTANNGTTTILGPMQIEAPSTALAVALGESVNVGCNGVLGSLSVDASGGWGNYQYHWSNGEIQAYVNGLTAGNYTVTVTDDNNCTKTFVGTVGGAIYPTISIVPPGTITCAQPTLQINGSGSSSGSTYSYQWFASNGGTIVGGGTTLTPTVSSAGNYSLQIINTDNSCEAFGSTSVQSNLTAPAAAAGPPAAISCTVPSVVLQGTGSSGNNFTYLWTATNGGNITSGANTLTPTVNASGTYTLKVTNTTNGCSQASATTVTGAAQPSLGISGGAITCLLDTITLTTNTSAVTPLFAWTGPNGYTATIQSPMVTDTGSYNLIVTDQTSGCTVTGSAAVVGNNAPPGASATGGALTCVIANVTITVTTPDTNTVFAWTGPNNFASSLQNPVVAESGLYTVVVSDTLNGCTASAGANVALNNTNPSAEAVAPGTLNCNAIQVQLNSGNSSQGANFVYAWSTTNGNIVSGQNTQTPVVDQAGSYALLVSNTDNGCTSTASANVIQNQAITSTSTQANVSCHGAANGGAAILPTGGNGVYSYNWSNGATTPAIENLATGEYIVVVTDGENCTTTGSVSIAQPDLLSINATATAQTSNGVNDGTAMAGPLGGTAGYSYLWSNSETTQSIVGLAPGNYTVVVTDAHGCTSLQTVTVNSFNCTIAATITGTNVSCFGANNGVAESNLSGAADPVTYAWSNGASSSSIANLPPGEYTVDITDGNNCPAQLNITIVEPLQLQSNATASGETSAGANDGTAMATPNGGAGNYTFEWNTGASTQGINNLAPGAYTVVVTDGNGCTDAQTVNVNTFNCALTALPSIANVSCAGAANGAVTLAPANGVAPFTYNWSNGGNTATIVNLSGGAYTSTVIDANGCEAITTADVVEPAPFTPWTFDTTQPVCPAEATGTATASIAGGTAPYSFAWSNGASSNIAMNLVAGIYTVSVTDQNNCQSSTSVAITASDNVAPTVSVQNATIALNSTGQALVTLAVLSGVATDNCAVASTVISPNQFDCDALGDHLVTVTVTDGSGSSATATATVTVVDNQSPVVNCPNSMTACSYDNIVTYNAPVAIDNCLSANGGDWTLDAGLPSGSEFPAGVTTQKYTYTDASGNSGSCQFEVIITPAILFGSPFVSNDVNGQGTGSISINLSGGNAPYTFEWTREGEIVGVTQNLSDLHEGTYSVIVTDANGCEYELTDIKLENTVSAKEPVWLSGVRLQPNPTSGITRILFAQAPESTLEISVVDATGRIVLTQISEGQLIISLDGSALPQGFYTLRFRTGEETGVRKLVISR